MLTAQFSLSTPVQSSKAGGGQVFKYFTAVALSPDLQVKPADILKGVLNTALATGHTP